MRTTAGVLLLVLAAGCSTGQDPAAPPTSAPPGPSAASVRPVVDNTAVTTDTLGAPLDAHDGTIVQDPAGVAWLVGTAYGCGFVLNAASPWCGVRVYRSADLRNWAPAGAVGGTLAFDPYGRQWQDRCGGDHFGCFRPHIGRRPDGTWVLWINTPATPAGYSVLTAAAPGGPYVEQPPPVLAADGGSTRLAGGDLDLVVDGADAWLAYVTIGPRNTPSDLAIEKLNASWTSGTGQVGRLGKAMTEAPGVFKRGGGWHLVFSDPAAPYGITGAGYATAPSPLGPWTLHGRISDRSCEGQTADVNLLTGPAGTAYAVWQVDRWAQVGKRFATNQYRARTYLAPLVFDPDGGLPTQPCVTGWAFD